MSDETKVANFVEVKNPYASEIQSITSAFEKTRKNIMALWDRASAYDAEEAYEAGRAGADNIVGVGMGIRTKEGQPTGEICVKTYVVEKFPEEEVSPEALSPEEVDGITVDVEAVGEIVAWGGNRRARWRPAPGGVSIGHIKITAGTLGAFCCSTKPAEPLLILSNNHVLANSNDAKIGDPIVQPGPYDGGMHPRDTIAKLFDFVPIDFSGKPNLVDAALAKPIDGKSVMIRIMHSESTCTRQGHVKVRGVTPPVLNERVKKSGRTTSTTCGVITGVVATVNVNYGGGRVARFEEQIIITPGGFSAGGDSGSIILDKRNRARALLFAGSPTHTIANPIQHVLAELSKPPRVISGLQILDS